MAAGPKAASAMRVRKQPAATISDRLRAVLGQLTHEVGIVESLAHATATIAGKAARADRALSRRVFDLLVALEVAALTALATAEALNAQGTLPSQA